mgnify:CR=1 FL=1
MVFNGVVGPAFKVFSNDGPLILLLLVDDVQNELFLLAPFVLFDPRVQMVVPTFATLLADPTGQVAGDVRPFLGPIRLHE